VEGLAADKARFFQAFVASMDRMGSIRIKKGKEGEVKKSVASTYFDWWLWWSACIVDSCASTFHDAICVSQLRQKSL
jgi:hypothetical protein